MLTLSWVKTIRTNLEMLYTHFSCTPGAHKKTLGPVNKVQIVVDGMTLSVAALVDMFACILKWEVQFRTAF